MKPGNIFIISLIIFVCPLISFSTTIVVPDDQPTIQLGVDAALDGDTVLVRPGIYTGDGNRNIILSGKEILLKGDKGRDSTIIDLQDGAYSGFDLFSSEYMEDSTTVIDGFSIINGANGFRLMESSPRIINMLFEYCDYGIHCTAPSSPILDNCRFQNNVIGLKLSNGYFPVTLENCEFIGNTNCGASNDVYGKVIKNCYFEQNTVGIRSDVSLSAQHCTIDSCEFQDDSLAVYGDFHLLNSTIVGGGISGDICGTEGGNGFSATNCTFEKITGIAIGGAPWGADITDCIIRDNFGDVTYIPRLDCCGSSNSFVNCDISNNAGGISLFGDCRLVMDNCLYNNNGSPITLDLNSECKNIAIENYKSRSRVDITSSTIINNANGAIYVSLYDINPDPIYIENSIIANNLFGIKDSVGDNLYEINCNDFFNNDSNFIGIPNQIDTNGNLALDPFFCYPDTGNYYLYDISPCASENNSCASLIGAFDVGCIDLVPEIISSDSVSVLEDSLLVYQVVFTDDDGPDTILNFENLPAWILTDADSAFGTPLEGDIDTALSIIISDGFKADSLELFIEVIPVNDTPILDSIGPQSILENEPLELLITATDEENDSIVLSAFDLPANAVFVDSGNGIGLFSFIPDLDQANDYHILFVADDTISADSQIVLITVNEADAVIHAIFVDSLEVNDHVINHHPFFEWSYTDPLEVKAQTQFKLAVGTDADWEYAEMWNPSPFETPDTFVAYNGSPLLDGATYYLRMQVYNNYVWSAWYESSFRMNSLPSVPNQLLPGDSEVLNVGQPTLWLENSTDAENDSLAYDFIVTIDSTFDDPDTIQVDNNPEGIDSTGWTVPETLSENYKYWWRVRAFDNFEYSAWSDSNSFWINLVEEAAILFRTEYPPDSGGAYVTDLAETFQWMPAYDPDPMDSIYYQLYLSVDSIFSSPDTVDSIWSTEYIYLDSLDYTTHYWWQVAAIDKTGMTTYSDKILDFYTWMPGDPNGDYLIDIIDISFMIAFLYQANIPPNPLVMGDINSDCTVNLLDITYLIAYLYQEGPAPLIGCE